MNTHREDEKAIKVETQMDPDKGKISSHFLLK